MHQKIVHRKRNTNVKSHSELKVNQTNKMIGFLFSFFLFVFCLPGGYLTQIDLQASLLMCIFKTKMMKFSVFSHFNIYCCHVKSLHLNALMIPYIWVTLYSKLYFEEYCIPANGCSIWIDGVAALGFLEFPEGQ